MPPTESPAAEGWIGPIAISDRHYFDIDMLVDGDGFVHVAALLDDAIWHVTNRSGRWTREAVSDPPSDRQDDSPSIAVDPENGSLHIAFARRATNTVPSFSEGAYASTNASGDWSEPALIEEAAEEPRYVDGAYGYSFNDTDVDDAVELNDVTRPMYVHDGFIVTTLADFGRALALHADPQGRVSALYVSWPGGRSDRARAFIARGLGPDELNTEPIPDIRAGGHSFEGGFGASGDVYLSWSQETGSPRVFTYQTASGWAEPRAGDAHALDDQGAHALLFNEVADGQRVSYFLHRDGEWDEHELLTAPDPVDGSLALDAQGRPHIFISGPTGTWYAVGPGR